METVYKVSSYCKSHCPHQTTFRHGWQRLNVKHQSNWGKCLAKGHFGI